MKKDIIITNGLEGLDDAIKAAGANPKDIEWEVHDGDSFVARRTRMEIARRNKQRTPKPEK